MPFIAVSTKRQPGESTDEKKRRKHAVKEERRVCSLCRGKGGVTVGEGGSGLGNHICNNVDDPKVGQTSVVSKPLSSGRDA